MEYVFTEQQAAFITADLCYRAKTAINKYNPDAKIVFPGMTNIEITSPKYFKHVYEQIEAGYLPSGRDFADVNVDSFFDIVSWHPYMYTATETVERWNERNEEWRDVMRAHGDEYKSVWFTEMGFSELNYGGEAGQNMIASLTIALMDKIISDLPYVEAVIMFRLTNSYQVDLGEFENNFGLFYSPDDGRNQGRPKPVAYALYEYFHNQKATDSTFVNNITN